MARIDNYETVGTRVILNGHYTGTMTSTDLLNSIRPGDRVTIHVPNGIGRTGVEWKEATGRAVMPGPAGWVLNLGGRYGTPGVATVDNLVRVRRSRA